MAKRLFVLLLCALLLCFAGCAAALEGEPEATQVVSAPQSAPAPQSEAGPQPEAVPQNEPAPQSEAALPQEPAEAPPPPAEREPLTLVEAVSRLQESGGDIQLLDEAAVLIHEEEGCLYYLAQNAMLEGFEGSFLYIIAPTAATVEFVTPNVTLDAYYALAEDLGQYGALDFVWYNQDEHGLHNTFEVPDTLKEVKGVVSTGRHGALTLGEYDQYTTIEIAGWYKYERRSTVHQHLFADGSGIQNILLIQFILFKEEA